MTFVDLVFSGDLVLDEPNPDHWLGGIAPALQRADLAIGHLEVPHSRRNGPVSMPSRSLATTLRISVPTASSTLARD
jgi:hypothetical protein